ncbi:hypothetical protein [Luteolibacter soli]|uniref:CENP-V/GFA domain-containing protein n=1 Tax=Luteolibacter soli TaxID=3135280 RepID=A0ABU9B2D3_9BACT
MKFACACGNLIPDQTDYLSYAAHLIADQDLYDATAMSERGSSDWWPSLTRKLYQCDSCGRLWIEDRGRELRAFVPEEPAPHFLSSIHGDQWKRILRGEWRDERVIATLPRGFLGWAHLSEEDHATFDDWGLLERAYYDRFEELKKRGILRDAMLTKNGETVHSWGRA